MYRLNSNLNNALEECEKGIIKAIYRYDWCNHGLMSYKFRTIGEHRKLEKTYIELIDRKFINIFYHYYGI